MIVDENAMFQDEVQKIYTWDINETFYQKYDIPHKINFEGLSGGRNLPTSNDLYSFFSYSKQKKLEMK